MDVLTNENFDSSISSGIVLVDFYADWCGPCHALAPTIEELSQKYNGKVSFYKLDVDAAGQIAQRYQVMSIPTVMVFKDGEAKSTIVGAQPEARYTEVLDQQLS